MKTCVVLFAVAAVCILSASCMPLDVEDEQQPLLVRQKRVTCDLLSVEAKGVKLNHAACAAHCLVLGKRGGHCNSGGVCVCRN